MKIPSQATILDELRAILFVYDAEEQHIVHRAEAANWFEPDLSRVFTACNNFYRLLHNSVVRESIGLRITEVS